MALLLLVVCRALIALPSVTQPRTPRIAQNKTRFSPITHCARGLGHTGLGLRACSCDGRRQDRLHSYWVMCPPRPPTHTPHTHNVQDIPSLPLSLRIPTHNTLGHAFLSLGAPRRRLRADPHAHSWLFCIARIFHQCKGMHFWAKGFRIEPQSAVPSNAPVSPLPSVLTRRCIHFYDVACSKSVAAVSTSSPAAQAHHPSPLSACKYLAFWDLLASKDTHTHTHSRIQPMAGLVR
jgi:hypothetical protein